MKTELSKPQGYVEGAYHFEATLVASEVEDYLVCPITFEIPKIPNWHIHTPLDSGFIVAVTDERGTYLRGQFREAKWESDIYTNGVEEKDNLTSISDVEVAIKASIMQSLQKIEGVAHISKNRTW